MMMGRFKSLIYSKILKNNQGSKMKQALLCSLLLILFVSFFVLLFYSFGRSIWEPYYKKFTIIKDIQPQESKEHYKTTIQTQHTQPSESSDSTKEHLSTQRRLHRHLADSNFVIYPSRLTLIGLKYEKKLEVWGELHGKWVHIQDYPFSAFSGRLGPKLKEGDRQIPEGIYKVTYLNPNSKFHLSMRLNYPNAFDKKIAKKERRTDLGGDIMIHGSNKTVGCIPIGDESIEELYLLAQKVGIENIKVILSPVDFRIRNVEIKNNKHPWLNGLYSTIKQEMQPFTL
jgi:hypothetical protein